MSVIQKPRFPKTTYGLLPIILVGVLLVLVRPISAQSMEGHNVKSGSIVGTVVDINDHPVSNANIVLQGPAVGDQYTVVTKDDGAFAFDDVKPHNGYQISVSAAGFSDWTSVVTVGPGEIKTLTDIKLRIPSLHRTVTVAYSSKEVATQQFKAEEQQRVLRFIPNTYVTYESHPEPLTTKRKFELAYKHLTHPIFFTRVSLAAGIHQAGNRLDYPQGAEGYAKRFGAAYGDAATENMFGNAILPSLLHQDPRYFYQGDGTKKSRAFHAIAAPFVCKGDNGKSQPNYSTVGGLLISNAISNAYYPNSNRGAGLVFSNFGIGMGGHVAVGLIQEFILDKLTSRGKRNN